jgi:hypothetical protein
MKKSLLFGSALFVLLTAMAWNFRSAVRPELTTTKATSPEPAPRMKPIATAAPKVSAPHSEVALIGSAVALMPSAPARLQALPDASVKLADSIAALTKSAEAGEVQAAARLMHEAKCCQQMAGLVYSLEQWPRLESRLRQLSPDARAKAKQMLSGELIEMDRFCGTLKDQTLGKILVAGNPIRELLRERDPATRLRWLKNPEDYQFRRPGVRARIEALQVYEQTALASLHQLIASGNLDAVAINAAIHATPNLHGDLGSLVQQDWYTTAIYNYLYIRAGGGAYRQRIQGFIDERMPRVLTPIQLAQAKAEADTIYERYFKGKAITEYGTELLGLTVEKAFQPTPAAGSERKCPTIQSYGFISGLVAGTQRPTPAETP